MKELKRLTAAPVLILALTISTYAGIIDLPAPPPPPASSSALTEPGDIQLPETTEEPGLASPTVTDVALELLQQMMQLF